MFIPFRSPLIIFALGVIFGALLFIYISESNNSIIVRSNIIHYLEKALEDKKYVPFKAFHSPGSNISASYQPIETIDVLPTLYPLDQPKSTNDTEYISKDALFHKVRVLCMIVTAPKYHKKRALHIKRTWGRRCNKLVFMSTQDDINLGSTKLNVTEGYSTLWGKTKRSVELAYTNYLDEADWFFKADDDTYAIMENLRHLLKDYDSNEGHYFGCQFKWNYASGGAGYVLSKRALIKLNEEGLKNKSICSQSETGYEDVEMGKCMSKLGIPIDDSRDKYGRYRFLALPPIHHLMKGHMDKNFWWWKYVKYPTEDGPNCCSDTTITFHYVQPNEMYLFDFFLYHVRPVGVHGEEVDPSNSSSI